MLARGPVVAWVVDDTGLPKKGRHSVGVARQYCGRIGKPDNCQVAVSLSVTTETSSMPIAYRLDLPEVWASDSGRREKVRVPAEIQFRTKLGIQSTTTVWKPGQGPKPAPAYRGTGRPPRLLRRDQKHQPVSVKDPAMSLESAACKTVAWRQGVKQKLRSRFAAMRIRPAHRDYWRGEPHPEEWLLMEWPKGEAQPTKYRFSTLPAETSLSELVRTAKHRWIVERDYEELKQELGLGRFEGRGWRGFHHHATLCLAAYGFLVAERNRFSPSARSGHLGLPVPDPPPDFRPRGSRPRRAA